MTGIMGNEEMTDTRTEKLGLGRPCTLIETHQHARNTAERGVGLASLYIGPL